MTYLLTKFRYDILGHETCQAVFLEELAREGLQSSRQGVSHQLEKGKP